MFQLEMEGGEMAFSGERAREIRRSRGMSQAAVASRMGVSPTYLSAWERGRCAPNGQNMVRLLQALGCEPGELEVTK